MKSSKLVTLLSLCLFVYTVFLASSGLCAQTDVLIDKLLNQSGLSEQIEFLPVAVLSAVPEDAFPDQKAKVEIGSLMKKTAGKDRLLSLVRDALSEDFNREMIEKVLSFYDSKLGRKVGRVQGTALAPALIKAVREGRKTAASMDEARLDLLRRLIKAERVTQSNEKLLQSVVKGLIDGSLVESASRDATSPDGLTGIEREIRFDEARAQDIALVAFAHAFRPLDNKELEELAVHKESEAGTWFEASVQKGLNRAAYETGKTLGEAAYKWRKLNSK
jgi:hypothetical protein